jgi:hypothetical protein
MLYLVEHRVPCQQVAEHFATQASFLTLAEHKLVELALAAVVLLILILLVNFWWIFDNFDQVLTYILERT